MPALQVRAKRKQAWVSGPDGSTRGKPRMVNDVREQILANIVRSRCAMATNIEINILIKGLRDRVKCEELGAQPEQRALISRRQWKPRRSSATGLRRRIARQKHTCASASENHERGLLSPLHYQPHHSRRHLLPRRRQYLSPNLGLRLRPLLPFLREKGWNREMIGFMFSGTLTQTLQHRKHILIHRVQPLASALLLVAKNWVAIMQRQKILPCRD